MKDFFLFLLVLFILPNSAYTKTIERVEAVVEGQMVLKSELRSFQKNFNNKSLVNQNLITLAGIKAKPKKKEALDYLILKKMIVLHSSKEKGGADVDAVADREITKLAKQNNVSTSALKSELKTRGVDFETYKKFIGESSLIRDTIERNVVSQVRPTEEDFVSYLKKNDISSIKTSYTYDLDQIFISKGLNDKLKIAKKINSNNFKEYFKNADALGLDVLSLGTLRYREISPRHQSHLKSAKAESVKVIEEKNGFRIFYVNSKTTSYKIPNTQKIQGLQKVFYDGLIKDRFKSWSDNIKQGFFVRINS